MAEQLFFPGKHASSEEYWLPARENTREQGDEEVIKISACAVSVSGNRVRRLGKVEMTMFVAGAAVLLAAALPAAGDPGPDSGGTILLGMSTALSGPAAVLGTNMRTGVLAAFEEANQAGGVNGCKLRLVALDDGYEPERTVPNMHQLIEEEGVLAIIGNVGTPTAVAAIPIANAKKTPFFGAFTGAGVLRKNPPDRYVINYRASYAEETVAMVDALIEVGKMKPEEIAFFTQRDTYGDAGFAGGLAALKRHGLQNTGDVVHGRYERNTLAVENALADILFHEPLAKAVVMVGAYAPCAEFIRLAKANGLDVLFLNVSFVGAEPLLDELGEEGDGVIATQVVPHFDSDLPIVARYRAALQLLDQALPPTFGALEGYTVGHILCQALRTIEGKPTREAIVDALEGLGDFDIGLGEPLHLGPGDHQACHRVWPTVLRGGKAVPYAWTDLGTVSDGE